MPDGPFTGMPCRMPLIRSRPWVFDTVWCAHESHPAIWGLAKVLPLNGLWRLTADGSERLDAAEWPDLASFMADLDGRAVEPLDLVGQTPLVADHRDSITAEMVVGQRVFATLPDGNVVAANLAIVATFTRFSDTLTWKVAPPTRTRTATLCGYDRKGEHRVAVACLEEDWEEVATDARPAH